MSNNSEVWLATQTGGRCYPFAPSRNVFSTEDICHALGNLCRFGGHTKWFYSVAEHSLHVADEVDRQTEGKFTPLERLNYRLYALLHDASEAYLVDVPRPVKECLGDYRIVEGNLMTAILESYGLLPVIPDLVWEADDKMLATEAFQLLQNTAFSDFAFTQEPLEDVVVRGISPMTAKFTLMGQITSTVLAKERLLEARRLEDAKIKPEEVSRGLVNPLAEGW